MKAICPGTFDPITNGHIDIIKRAAVIFKEVIIAVAKESPKSALFTHEERVEFVKASIKNLKNVQVKGFQGLVVDFASKNEAKVIVRGLRMISDFEYEFQMALTNRNLAPAIETVFLMPQAQYSYISSRLIKEAVFLGANLSDFLPPLVLAALKKRVERRKKRKNNK